MHEIIERNQQLIEFLESKGYSPVPVNGYKVINNYSGIEEEISTLYKGVGLRNISHHGIIEMKGKDVLDFLHRISTNSIKDLPKEGVRKTIFTSDKGRIIGLTTLINFENYQLIVCAPDSKNKIISWTRKYVISDDVLVNDANTKYNLLELSGPQAASFATLICGKTVSEIEQNTFRIINTENLLFFLIRLEDERGFAKYWFLADFENTKRLISYMLENTGVFDFRLIGEEAFNTYRIEQGLPASPNELNDNTNPHETGLTSFIDFKKGCYIGQEVIARLDTYDKVQRRLTGIRFQDIINPNESFSLYSDNTEAGIVTSMAYSPKLKTYIGLSFVKKVFLSDGTTLQAANNRGEKKPVVLEPLPFVK